MIRPLVESPDGDQLAELIYCTEATVGEHIRTLHLHLSGVLVVLFRGERVLLADNLLRSSWELPGGHVDPGESPRAAAVRELREESGLDVAELELGFLSHVLRGPYRRDAWDAVYVGRVPEAFEAPGFVPNDEIAAVRWWQPGEALDRLAPLDAMFAELAGDLLL